MQTIEFFSIDSQKRTKKIYGKMNLVLLILMPFVHNLVGRFSYFKYDVI